MGTKPTVVPRGNDDPEPVSDDDDDEDDLDDDEEEAEQDDLLAEANEVEASDEDVANGNIPGLKPMRTLYELNDTLFAEADIQEDGQVGLWLGANTMLMYPLDEAILLLAEKLSAATRNLKNLKEDLEFLREQVTVMEVNFARVHNVSQTTFGRIHLDRTDMFLFLRSSNQWDVKR